MEVLTEEETRELMETMFSSFTYSPSHEFHVTQLAHKRQEVLLIHGPGQKYELEGDKDLPCLQSEREILIKVVAIGLNPVDWKGPAFNFGHPSFPWINGRDVAGVVIKAHGNLSRIRVGDVVLSPSTDYRDTRKAAFQEYVVTTEYNSARIPEHIPVHEAAVIGVAFVAASLALGICLGVSFSNGITSLGGPDLFDIVRRVNKNSLASDIRDECLNGITQEERAKPGDWIVIWGASSASGLIAFQLAKLAKLRTICIVDVARHGEKLLEAGADLLVDRYDTERAIQIVQSVTRGNLRFGLDTVGSETAENLQRMLSTNESRGRRSHLVGLASLPKSNKHGIIHHTVPIKAFHSVVKLGESLMTWLERLLLTQQLRGPDTEIATGGLSGINEALEMLRNGPFNGKRFVVPLEDGSQYQRHATLVN